MDKEKVIILVMLVLCSIFGYALDGDWKTHVIESREGYEEAIHWREPSTYYINYTKPKNAIMDSYWLVAVDNISKKICFKITLLDVTFDIQSTDTMIPLGPMVRWKNIDWDKVKVIEIQYGGCKK